MQEKTWHCMQDSHNNSPSGITLVLILQLDGGNSCSSDSCREAECAEKNQELG